MRRFELHRDEDVTGVSGTGVVAEGVAFSADGPVALRWTSEWPTSVVFHDRGVASLEAVHGHSGRTRIVWLECLRCGPDGAAVSGGLCARCHRESQNEGVAAMADITDAVVCDIFEREPAEDDDLCEACEARPAMPAFGLCPSCFCDDE
jgi:hypothetical protein